MDFFSPFIIISHVSAVSVLMPFIFSIVKFKTLNSTLRVLFIYLFSSIVIEIINLLLTANDIPTHTMYNVFTFMECTLLSYIYYLEFKDASTRKILLFLYGSFILVVCLALFYFKNFNQKENITSTYESCMVIGFAVSFFYKVNTELNIPRLREHYFFWLNSAFLIYFSASFFLFLFDSYLETYPKKIFNILYSIHWLNNITYNILLLTAIWKHSKQK